MFGHTRRVLGVLAGTTGLTLALGVGASTGLVPKLADTESASSDLVAAATVTPDVPVPVVDTTVPPTTVVEVTTTVPPTTAAPKPTTPPTTRAPAPRVTVAAAPAPAPAAAAAPALAPRRTPSAAEVQQAITGISGMVRLPLLARITPAHVADIGNQICTAFDQGKSFAEVKSTGLATVTQYGVSVSPAAADYAVRTAVTMYCPGYASKLV